MFARATCDMIAPAIFVDWRFAFWTLLCISCEPLIRSRITVLTLQFLCPLFNHLTINWHMRFLCTLKAKLESTCACNINRIGKFILHYFATVCPWAPLGHLREIDERLYDKLFVFSKIWGLKHLLKNPLRYYHVAIHIWTECINHLWPTRKFWLAISRETLQTQLVSTVIHRGYIGRRIITKAHRTSNFGVLLLGRLTNAVQVKFKFTLYVIWIRYQCIYCFLTSPSIFD